MNEDFSFICHIGDDSLNLTFKGSTPLSFLLSKIHEMSGIPPSRQHLMMDSGNINTSNTDRSLSTLGLASKCDLLIIDKEPHNPKIYPPQPSTIDSNALNPNINQNTNNSQSKSSENFSVSDTNVVPMDIDQPLGTLDTNKDSNDSANDDTNIPPASNIPDVSNEPKTSNNNENIGTSNDASIAAAMNAPSKENANNESLGIMDDPRNFIEFNDNKFEDSNIVENNFNPFNVYNFDDSFLKASSQKPTNDDANESIDMKYILISTEELAKIKHLLWGANGNEKDIYRWYSQGFGFVEDADHNNDIRFGLLQLHGGPCGILAPVQAYMLREMLFNSELAVKLDDGSAKTPILPTNEQRETALINALVHIMAKCAIDPTYLQWIVTADIENNHFYKVICHSVTELQKLIRQSLPLLYSKIGVVCFVFSVLLSRTLDGIMNDMDDRNQPLILPQHGHCSQDIVNLMITGFAHTNIHDNDKHLGDPNDADCFILKGIGANQEIGFLTTLEVMRLAKVGDHYKCPKYPIWIIGSSSHYTVLFSLNINVSNVSKADKKRQDLKRAFHKFDPDETGILKWSEFPKLLKELKCDINANSIKQLVDPENTGHIFWYGFERAWQMIETQAKLAWQCGRCTLYNKVSLNYCSVCTGARNNAAIVERPKGLISNSGDKELQTKTAPMQFVMYLYNGLKATKKDRPTVTKLKVFDDAEIHAFPSAIAEELTGLIRTKWPLAVVEYDGPFVPHVQ